MTYRSCREYDRCCAGWSHSTARHWRAQRQRAAWEVLSQSSWAGTNFSFQIKCCVFNSSVLFSGLVGCLKACSLPDLNLKQRVQVVKSVLLYFIPNSSVPPLQCRHKQRGPVCRLNCNNVSYCTQYIRIIVIWTCNHYKLFNKIFIFGGLWSL